MQSVSLRLKRHYILERAGGHAVQYIMHITMMPLASPPSDRPRRPINGRRRTVEQNKVVTLVGTKRICAERVYVNTRHTPHTIEGIPRNLYNNSSCQVYDVLEVPGIFLGSPGASQNV